MPPAGGSLVRVNYPAVHAAPTLTNVRVLWGGDKWAFETMAPGDHFAGPMYPIDGGGDMTLLFSIEGQKQAWSRKIGNVVTERIERDENGLAARLFPITRDDGLNARSILIDPSFRFGRPILASTNLETAVVADRFFAGDSTAVLAADFEIDEATVEEAIRFESQLRAA